MSTITIDKKEYQELKVAQERLRALQNLDAKKNITHIRRGSFVDLVGALKDVPEFKDKTSVEVQHMIRDLWHKKRS